MVVQVPIPLAQVAAVEELLLEAMEVLVHQAQLQVPMFYMQVAVEVHKDQAVELQLDQVAAVLQDLDLWVEEQELRELQTEVVVAVPVQELMQVQERVEQVVQELL